MIGAGFRLLSSTSVTFKALRAARRPLETFQHGHRLVTRQSEGKGGRPATKVKDDPDTFGTVAAESSAVDVGRVLPSTMALDLDDGDGEEDLMIRTGARPFDFLVRIEGLVNKQRPPDLRAALEIFEVEMKAVNVKPVKEIHRVLIHACGRLGYSDKAFGLYRDYCARSFPVNFGIFADLFNSCANCSESGDAQIETRALRHATRLRQKLKERHGILPGPVYRSMIKAFGKCGDLQTAFEVLDEMAAKKIPIDSKTLSSILQACISDKNAGFRHALLLWRKMRQLKIEPSVYNFNLMLRAAKECGMGQSAFITDILIETMSGPEIRKIRNSHRVVDEAASPRAATANDALGPTGPSKEVAANSEVELMEKDAYLNYSVRSDAELKPPNFLAARPDFSKHSIVGFSEEAMRSPVSRFSLFGGTRGFVSVMTEEDKVRPNIKTFSQMLSCIEPTKEAEDELVSCMDEQKVAPDVDFFNQLIRRRVGRGDYNLARSTLDAIVERHLTPDIATFGCLSMTCVSNDLSYQMLKDMKDCNLRPNVIIFTSLIMLAAQRYDAKHVALLLKAMENEEVKPNLRTLKLLEAFYKDYRDVAVKVEAGVDSLDCFGKGRNLTSAWPKIHPAAFERVKRDVESGSKRWIKFLQSYKAFLDNNEVEAPEHPWKQFLTSKDIKLAGNGNRKISRLLEDFIP